MQKSVILGDVDQCKINYVLAARVESLTTRTYNQLSDNEWHALWNTNKIESSIRATEKSSIRVDFFGMKLKGSEPSPAFGFTCISDCFM